MKLRILRNLKKLKYLLPAIYLLMVLISYVVVAIPGLRHREIIHQLMLGFLLSGLISIGTIPVIGKPILDNVTVYLGEFIFVFNIVGYLFPILILFVVGYLLDRHFKK